MKITPLAIATATLATTAFYPHAVSGYIVMMPGWGTSIRSPTRQIASSSVDSYIRAIDRAFDNAFDNDFDNDFDNFFFETTPAFSSLLNDRPIRSTFVPSISSLRPTYDIFQDDEKYQMLVEVPGFQKENIEVEVKDDGNILSISGSKNQKGRDSSLSFQQSFTLGPNVDKENIGADLTDGILTVTVPKKAPVVPKSRNIPLTRGKATSMMAVSGTEEMKKEGSLEESAKVEERSKAPEEGDVSKDDGGMLPSQDGEVSEEK